MHAFVFGRCQKKVVHLILRINRLLEKKILSPALFEICTSKTLIMFVLTDSKI